MPARPAILGPNGRPLPRREATAPHRAIKSRYDASVTSPENRNHWEGADSYSARAANAPQVRRTLRNRARYEAANNGYAAGIVDTLANDTIGTGPRLQVLTGDRAANVRLATAFEEWTAAVGLAELLRTMRMSLCVDGEAFAVFATNPKLPTPVQLDLRDIECDQVATPFQFLPSLRSDDGIEFDGYGNPAFYHVLKEHPGDLLHFGEWGAFDRVPADQVIHWFRRRRPDQVRGVPELTPALGLFAQMRRYTLATLSAAEIAAMFAALLKSSLPPDTDADGNPTGDGIAPFDTQEIVRGMMTALPDGYEMQQLRAEQPTTTYKEFKAELLNEVARPLNVPYGVAAGNSKEYNYSSGRLDHQVYHRAIGVDRYWIECHVLDRVLRAWLAEARLAAPSLVAGLDPARLPRHRWGWDGFKHVDPEKEAAAQHQRFANGTTTLELECAEDGYDWRDVVAQQAEERAYCLALGVPYPGDTPAPAPAGPPTRPGSPPDPVADPYAEGRMGTQPKIAAAAEPAALLLATAPVELHAAKGEGKRPTFDIVGYTGAVMNVAGFYSPVIVDLAGLKAPSQTIPALFGHDDARIVGQTDSIKIAGDVRLAGTITGENADAVEVITQARNGFRWQASIGASIDRREFLDAGSTTTVNGREVAGPVVIAREATLYEISFVAIGADGQTSAAVAASLTPGHPQGSHPMQFDDWLKAKGFADPAALSDTQRASLRALFDKEQAGAGATAGASAGTAVAASGGTTTSTATTANAAPLADPALAQNLNDIFAEVRRENERLAEITRITAQFVRERPGMADTLERMSRQAVEARMAPEQYELQLLRLSRAPAAAGFGIHAPDARDTAASIEAAVCRAGGLADAELERRYGDRAMEAAHRRFPQGVGLVELLTIAARENGYRGTNHRDVAGLLRAAFAPQLDVRADGFSTLSLPGILSNVANKFLAAGFNAVESTWRDVAARRPVNDFKAISTYSLTGGMMYEKVGPSGELKHATAGELVYTNQAEDYGRIFAITRRDIINDDLGALTAVPKKLGRGAALKLNDVFWSVFLNNSTFFSSGNVNLISGGSTALGIAALTTLSTTFMNQVDVDGFPLGITPRILLVPNALSVPANNLMTSTSVANDTTVNTNTLANNPFAGRYQVATSSYLSNSSYTGYSTTAWYLLASPDDLPVIEVAFLNGRETPIVESADAEFDTLGIQFRGYMDFGVAMQEFRAGAKSAGA